MVLRLSKREGAVLEHLLSLYPCLPAAHQDQFNPSGEEETGSSREVLAEALAEHRTECRKLVESWLSDPARTKRTARTWRLALAPGELDSLLQLLNDVRVGNWVRLGCPENLFSHVTAETAPFFWAMEMAGHFQMQILTRMEEGLS